MYYQMWLRTIGRAWPLRNPNPLIRCLTFFTRQSILLCDDGTRKDISASCTMATILSFRIARAFRQSVSVVNFAIRKKSIIIMATITDSCVHHNFALEYLARIPENSFQSHLQKNQIHLPLCCVLRQWEQWTSASNPELRKTRPWC